MSKIGLKICVQNCVENLGQKFGSKIWFKIWVGNWLQKLGQDRKSYVYILALLLVGDASQCCQLLDKLVSVCSELLQTLKCYSSFTSIMTCLTSHSVQNRNTLWENFRKNNMVTSLTFDRILKPYFLVSHR